MKPSLTKVIESLRSIHLNLVMLSLALILVVSLAESPDIFSGALQDLKIVVDLTNKETWDPLFLETILGRQDQGDVLYYDSTEAITFKKEELSKFNQPIFPTHSININYPLDIFLGWEYSPEESEPPYGMAQPRVDAPKTLGEFIQIWNKARNVKAITVIRLFNYAYVQRTPEFPVEKVDISREGTKDSFAQTGILTPNIFRSSDVEERDQDFYGLTTWYKNYYYYNYWKVWIPALTLDRAQFDAREYFCELMERDSSECKLPFEQMFPELYVATKNVQDVPFKQVEQILTNERRKQLESLEFFGIKIPTDLTNAGGVIALSAMQIYFLTHLLNLRSDIPTPQTEIPSWVGIFPDNLSRIFTVFSVVFLPAFTGIYLQIATGNAIANNREEILPIGLVTINTLISIIIFVKLIVFWKENYKTETAMTSNTRKSTKKPRQPKN